MDTDIEDQDSEAYDGYLDPTIDRLMDELGLKAPFMRTIYLNDATVPGNDDVEVWWFAMVVLDEEWQEITYTDFTWAVFSILAVYCYILFHTRSSLIAAVAMFQVGRNSRVGGRWSESGPGCLVCGSGALVSLPWSLGMGMRPGTAVAPRMRRPERVPPYARRTSCPSC